MGLASRESRRVFLGGIVRATITNAPLAPNALLSAEQVAALTGGHLTQVQDSRVDSGSYDVLCRGLLSAPPHIKQCQTGVRSFDVTDLSARTSEISSLGTHCGFPVLVTYKGSPFQRILKFGVSACSRLWHATCSMLRMVRLACPKFR